MAAVVFKYWLLERTMYAAPATGLRVQMTDAGAVYLAVLDFIYAPSRAAVGFLMAGLRIGGVIIDVLSDLLAVILQSLAIAAFMIWTQRPHVSACSQPPRHNGA